jgi:hypothetical protein
MLVRVGQDLLVTLEALPRIVTETTYSLMTVTMLRAMWLRVKVMVLCAMLSKIASTRPLMIKVLRCDERYHAWNVIWDLVYLNLNNVFDLHRVCAAPVLCRLRMLCFWTPLEVI